MLKSTLTGIAVAFALSIAPAIAQQTTPGTAHQDTSMVGLPIYSSDGERLGEITQVGIHEGQQVVLAEMGAFLGIGSLPVSISAETVTRKGDRVELPMTAEQVRNTISTP